MIAEVIWRTPQFSGDLRGSRKSPRDVEQAAEVLEQVAEVRNRSPLTPPPLNPGQFPPAQKPQSQNGANHCMHPPAPQPSNMDRETLDKSEQMYGMAPEHDTYSNGVDPYIQGPNEQHTYRLGLADEESYFDQTSGGEYNVNMFELYSAHPSHSGYMQYENPLIPAHYDTPYIQNATCPPQFLQVPPNRYCHGQQYHLQEDNHAPHDSHLLPGIPTASFGSSSGSLLLLEDESIPRSPSPENWDADPAFIEDSTDPDIRRLNELRKRSFSAERVARQLEQTLLKHGAVHQRWEARRVRKKKNVEERLVLC
ncbi:hypothetical protein C0989_004027 [Termitomyces sp. Mn162]|nr:hypothetical protein C0989_004027 [Termitomyces sp. Mn162]